MDDRPTPPSFTHKELYFYVAVALLIGFGSGAGAAGLLVGRGGGAAGAGGAVAATAVAPAAAPRIDVSTEGRPAWGPENATVTVVEFTDYQCPFCAQYTSNTYPVLKEAYGDRIRYVVRNFPVRSLHPWAEKAAEAAECAFEQGRFWEYHDLLFAQQAEIDGEAFLRHAETVGLDQNAFAECLDSGRMAAVVRRDLLDGVRHGIRGTPTFFINGRPLEGAQPLAVFEGFIEEALSEGRGSDAGR